MGDRYVYVIAQNEQGPCKVGVAKNPADRLVALQIGNPVRLAILATWALDDKAEWFERRIHDRLIDRNVGGEWFAVSVSQVTEVVDDLYFFEPLITQYPAFAPTDWPSLIDAAQEMMGDTPRNVVRRAMYVAGYLGVGRSSLTKMFMPEGAGAAALDYRKYLSELGPAPGSDEDE